MKSKLILMLAISAVVLSSCSKDEDTGGTVVPGAQYFIASDSTYDILGPEVVRKYYYNNNKKLVKVAFKDELSTTFDEYDTVIYNTAGQIARVESHTVGISTPYITNVYTYSGTQLTRVVESGTNSAAYVLTRTYTYASGKLSAISEVYNTGTGSVQNFTDFTFDGNNLSGLNYVGLGPITLTSSTTAANPYYGLGYDSEDFINLFNQNNILKAYETADPTSVLVENVYTYTSGRVSKIEDLSNETTTDITYIAL